MVECSLRTFTQILYLSASLRYFTYQISLQNLMVFHVLQQHKLLVTHLTFSTVNPRTNFPTFPFLVTSLQHFFLPNNPPRLSLELYLDRTFHRVFFLIHFLRCPFLIHLPPSLFTETYTLWRFFPVVSRTGMTGRKSRREEEGGGRVKSFLAACSIS